MIIISLNNTLDVLNVELPSSPTCNITAATVAEIRGKDPKDVFLVPTNQKKRTSAKQPERSVCPYPPPLHPKNGFVFCALSKDKVNLPLFPQIIKLSCLPPKKKNRKSRLLPSLTSFPSSLLPSQEHFAFPFNPQVPTPDQNSLVFSFLAMGFTRLYVFLPNPKRKSLWLLAISDKKELEGP